MQETTEKATPPGTPPIAQALALGAAMSAVMSAVLLTMGRVLWCSCGGFNPWSGDVWSSHNSQHLVDPYVFTHMLHGVLFFGLFRLLLGTDRLLARFGIALTLEAAWEIAENTPMVINRYRESTVSLDYFGDSIVNSVGDLWACALGFWFAWKAGWKWSVAVFLLFELGLLLTIRDSLLVNVIMLISPVDAIREWQMAGAP